MAEKGLVTVWRVSGVVLRRRTYAPMRAVRTRTRDFAVGGASLTVYLMREGGERGVRNVDREELMRCMTCTWTAS